METSTEGAEDSRGSEAVPGRRPASAPEARTPRASAVPVGADGVPTDADRARAGEASAAVPVDGVATGAVPMDGVPRGAVPAQAAPPEAGATVPGADRTAPSQAAAVTRAVADPDAAPPVGAPGAPQTPPASAAPRPNGPRAGSPQGAAPRASSAEATAHAPAAEPAADALAPASEGATQVAAPASEPATPAGSPVGGATAAGVGAPVASGPGEGPADGSGAVARPAAPPASLSPSRAADFMQCPLLYRFRVIDRLPEKPSEAATRGTLVHAVLERLFDAPAAERTVPRAKALLPGQWDRLRQARPELVELFADDADGERLARWLAQAEQLVERWFTLEDPTRLEPAERELFVEAELDSGLRLRGIIDRVDVAPTGEVRIVDYKTGKAPRPEYAESALFQMKFYALVVWRLKGVVPRRLQLVYLGSGDVLTYDPVPADLQRVERKLLALWEAIRQATETGDWRPRPTKLCGWCDHQAHCPEFGGTPPPYPLPLVRTGP
jgi:putative RecB family exonuclease